MRPFGCDSNRNADQGSFVQLVPLRPSSRRTQMILGTSWSYISKNWMHMVHSTHSTLIALIFWSAGQAICNHQATLHRDPKISPRMLETLANSFELWTDQCWILDLAGWLVDVSDICQGIHRTTVPFGTCHAFQRSSSWEIFRLELPDSCRFSLTELDPR